MSFVRRLLGPRSRRFIYFCFLIVGMCLNALPPRLVFLMLVVCDAIELKGRGRLYQAYFPYVTSRLAEDPTFCFSSRLSSGFKPATARVLHGIGAYREACAWILDNKLAAASADVAFALLRSLFELGQFEQAYDAVLGIRQTDPAPTAHLAHLIAMIEIIAGDEVAALRSMEVACKLDPSMLRPHQNIASRSPRLYSPNRLDVACGAPGRMFDLCNFAGQRVTHVGRGEVGPRLFERALDAQDRLRQQGRPDVSAALRQLLAELDVSLDDLKLIPEEWSTQIGHLGMLDILLRMQELGWWSGQPVMVVRPQLIANASFFRLFDGRCKVVIVGDMVTEPLAEELLSLQRWCGLNFNAFRLPQGPVVPWQEAGALALDAWKRQGRGHPLRDAYDRQCTRDENGSDPLRLLRERFGMQPDDWYVCLHTRDAAHYFEFMGTGQTHRNAPIEASLDAIRLITARGGWVIKLGGPNSPKLPPLQRTIDYALSEFRSDLMDIHLIRHARAFIGTTSGLTNVAVSFGIPCAIVNAITTDAQLWNGNVRFALKPVRLADGTMLTQRQLTSTPWRWRVFDAAVLGRSGAQPENNSAEEIHDTVEEVLAISDGRTAEFDGDHDAERLLSRWRKALALPYYYGTSRPSLAFLARHEKEFLLDATDLS
ncbi:TIGR04372 family glycosyltransferase [Bradyrhizobium aeschynomenes]|uniref:TIGR04372 family glycosyltransferase n=1 Tax=Bradyrhizobium aeschynomenes TaxID=2734909 RepID=UPI00155279F9|nr:TIGR04372 family glycosyltransferase [Bradyrhizobium aeschynomenes]NPV23006.1 TIGR04372 family glycosyltransferase [Bradyrhizobium aeschynomenes]